MRYHWSGDVIQDHGSANLVVPFPESRYQDFLNALFMRPFSYWKLIPVLKLSLSGEVIQKSEL